MLKKFYKRREILLERRGVTGAASEATNGFEMAADDAATGTVDAANDATTLFRLEREAAARVGDGVKTIRSPTTG